MLTPVPGVEETKRQRSGTWLYRRKQPDTQTPDQTSEIPSVKPVIHSSRPGDEKIPLGNLSHAAQPGPEAVPAGENGAPPTAGTASPRRFHLSRFDAPDPAAGRGPKRSRFASALFVERSGKRKKTADQPPATTQEEQTPDIEMDDAPAPPVQRRPGAKARAQPPAAARTPPKLPPSLQRRQYDTSTEALSREMDSWALEHIAHTLASQEDERARHPRTHTTPVKYRPKAPAKRFAERNPGVVSRPRGAGRDPARDGDSSGTEDEDYVMETYVRVPAHTLEAPVPPEQLGVLVFDQGSDVEYFYGLEDDSEDEFLEDEEDSNGMKLLFIHGLFPSLS